MKIWQRKPVVTERSTLLLQGIITILFGIVAIFWPNLTVLGLTYIVAVFLLVDGILSIVVGSKRRKRFTKSILFSLLGILQFIIALYILFEPKVSYSVFIMLLGITLFIRGLFAASHALVERDKAWAKTLHGLIGILGIVVGILFFMKPAGGGLAFIWIIGIYAWLAGIMLIALSSDV